MPRSQPITPFHAEFFRALKGGELEKLPGLAESWTPPYRAQSSDGATILHIVAAEPMRDHVAAYVVGCLGADRLRPLLKTKNKAGLSPLHEAIRRGNAEWTEALLSLGVDPCERDKENKLPLHHAILADAPWAVERFLPLNLPSIGPKEDSPIFSLLGANTFRCLPLLAPTPEALNTRDRRERNLLMRAARLSKTRLMNTLMAAGIDPMAVDDFGNNALHHLGQESPEPTFGKRTCALTPEPPLLSLTAALCDYGVDPRATNHAADTPLHHAVKAKLNDVTQMLLLRDRRIQASITKGRGNPNDESAPPRAIDAENFAGKTPLSLAIESHQRTLIELLLEFKADPNRPSNADGMTPLHEAAAVCFTDAIALLIKEGADPRTGDNRGRRPAALTTHPAALDWLAALDVSGKTRCTRRSWLKTPQAWFILRHLHADAEGWTKLMPDLFDAAMKDNALRREISNIRSIPESMRTAFLSAWG